MKRRVWIAAAAIAAIILILVFTLRGGDVPVRADRATRENISNTITTNGKIEPVDNFEAHAPAATTVKKIYVHEGDIVKPGQLLLQLDDANARADAARALARLRASQADLNAVETGGTHEEVISTQAELVKAKGERDSAERNLNAMRMLQQRGAATPAEVQEAENRLKTAEAQVNLLQQKLGGRYSRPEVAKVLAEAGEAKAAYDAAEDLLAHSNVKAPNAGTVYSLPVKQGAYVNPGDLLVQVADLTKMQVRAFVDEPEIGRLAKGQRVTVTWDALPGRAWEGTITRVPTTVTAVGSRTVGEITCAVDNRELKLLPNVNVSVQVTTLQHSQVVTVAREAVHQDDNQQFVYTISHGKLKRVDIRTGLSDLTRVEVTSGLPEGATVALGALNGQPLRDGLSVRVSSE
jgi:HlyD family secretion protein